jgi:hypothetical protein
LLIRDLDVPEAFDDRFFESAAVIEAVAFIVAESDSPPAPEAWYEFEHASEWLAELPASACT